MARIGQYALGASVGEDSSGNENDLVLTNAVTTTISHDGVTADGATVFDGTTSDAYMTGSVPEVSGQVGLLAFSFWTDGGGATGVPVGMGSKFFLQDSVQIITLTIFHSGGNQAFPIGATDDGNHNYVVSADGTDLKIWRDTVLVVDETMTGSVEASANDLFVGSLNATLFFYAGSIDDLIFFDVAQTQTDADALFVALDIDAPPPVDSITIVTPILNQPHQVDILDQADIGITGTYVYDGAPPPIEAQFSGGSWFTIDATPSGGAFSATLAAQAGDFGTLIVRFTTATTVNDSVDIGLGHIIPIWLSQSNGNGHIANLTAYTGTQPAFIWKTDGVAFVPVVEPCCPEHVGLDPAVYSHYPRLCNIIEADTGLPVYIVDTAQGGSGLVDGTPNTPGDWSPTGASYLRAVSIIDDSGITDALCAIGFHGENDQIFGSTKAEYLADLAVSYAGLRADTGLTTLRTVLSPVNSGALDPLDDIRAGQIEYWDTGTLISPGAITSDFVYDLLHFVTDAQSEAYCQRQWAKIKAAVGLTSAVRGPMFSAANLTSETDEALITWDAVGPLQEPRVDDYDASDDSGTLTIISTVVQDSIKVLVTFNRALSTNPIISYGDRTAMDGTTFRDSQNIPALNPAEIGIPAEPFVDEPIVEVVLPVVDITSPTTDPTYPTASSTINIGGTSSIASGTVESVVWENDRGGSGTCTGIATWSQNGITLLSGVNVLTVTATSDLGETDTDVLTVTYTPVINPVPAINITSPTTGPTYSTSLSTISIAGTSSISGGTVDEVVWDNDRGGSGVCTGIATWSKSAIALFSGVNVLTVTATSDLGETNTDELTVTYTAPSSSTGGGGSMDIVGIWNMAIGLVGGNKVLSPADESVESEECGLYYDTARTFCLENRDWTFAASTRQLAQDATPVSTEFAYSFTLPTDCLVVREVSSDSDLSGKLVHQKDGRSIVTDSSVVYIKYTRDITSTIWFSPSFKMAVAHKLAELISPALTGDKVLKRTLNEESEELLEGGGAIDGMQGSPKRAYASRLLRARLGGYGGSYYGLTNKV